MRTDEKIYVAGHGGLVGSALVRCLQAAGYTNLVTRSHAELDLTNPVAVRRFLTTEKPRYVMVAAAKVGGILANWTYPAEFVHENLLIQCNVLHESWRARVQRLLFLGSSCIYPRESSQPMKEHYLLTGPLEPTNRPYAIAKIAGIEMCWAYNRQYGTQFLAAMPSNLYGPGDNYDLQTSHALPALIRKAHEAKLSGSDLVIWGTGRPRREYLYSDDMADACLFLMNLPQEQFHELVSRGDSPPLINLGSGQDHSILELARLVANVLGYTGNIVPDPAKPDGTMSKLLDVTRLSALGWKPKTDLPTGIQLAYADFVSQLQHRGQAADPQRETADGPSPLPS